jgi:uncharacterized protein (TIGR03382 family)
LRAGQGTKFALKSHGILSLSILGLASSPAMAQTFVETPTNPSGVRPITGYKVVDLDPEDYANHSFSRILYLNNCLPNGCSVRPGYDDSRTNTTRLVDRSTTLAPFNAGTTTWNEVVECVREVFAPFDINIVTTDPGNVEHMEAMIAGDPRDADYQCDANGCIGGIAPFGCGYISNAISFAFANIYDGDVNEICSTAAQEIAHTWSLDHEMEPSDPMTYLSYSGRRYFQNRAVNCGEYSPASCYCGGSQQNSYQEVLSVFGPSTPTPPVVTITEPANGAIVTPGFVVRADYQDDTVVMRASLYINNQLIKTVNTPPFVFNAPDTMADGTHHVEVRAFDTQDTAGSDFIDVVVGEPCTIPGDCSAQGENFTCVGGRCVLGTGSPGGLGEYCENSTECYSGYCADDGVSRLCAENCYGPGECPGGFACVETGGGDSICWPGAESGSDSGGCSSAGGGAALPIALGGLAFLGLLPRRRRRSA